MTDPEFAAQIIGRRYGCNFVVAFIDYDGTVTLMLNGDFYKISLQELRVIIERGLVMEIPDGGTR